MTWFTAGLVDIILTMAATATVPGRDAALGLYRRLLRTRAVVFAGDANVLQGPRLAAVGAVDRSPCPSRTAASGKKIREEFTAYRAETNPKKLLKVRT